MPQNAATGRRPVVCLSLVFSWAVCPVHAEPVQVQKEIRMKLATISLSLLSYLGVAFGGQKVPIVYSTDLFHPHDDPDDHYDLATLFAIEEFDIKGIVLDLGERQKQRSGRPAVEQLSHLTGRCVPTAIGLAKPLKSRDDKALDQPEEFQGGVKLILETLRTAAEKVTLFSTGSCRDFAAAFNREPELFRQKVRAYYFNAGNGPTEPQKEWNVTLDSVAYQRAFEMPVPLYWCPCYGKDGYATLYVVDQTAIVGACTQGVQSYFVYCLSRSKEDPIAFLASGPYPAPKGPRKMWCTAPLLHAAGRDGAPQLFTFVPIRVTVGGDALAFALEPKEPNCLVFRATGRRYAPAMAACLQSLLAGLGKGNKTP